VPVGEDQLPHIELTREVARRFNRLYRPVFPEPKGLVVHAARVPGTDGRKMSKSYGNAVNLSDDPKTVHDKLVAHDDRPAPRARTDRATRRTARRFVFTRSTARTRRRRADAGCDRPRARLPRLQEES
jgi:tryptophanyl-tRNA synthetase